MIQDGCDTRPQDRPAGVEAADADEHIQTEDREAGEVQVRDAGGNHGPSGGKKKRRNGETEEGVVRQIRIRRE